MGNRTLRSRHAGRREGARRARRSRSRERPGGSAGLPGGATACTEVRHEKHPRCSATYEAEQPMTEVRAQPSILVVDDTRANIGFLLETLSQAGYRVRVAPDGETALEQIQYSPPDLVLLDVMMPGIDGFETCQRIRKLPQLSQLPVIFMTALSDTQDKVRAFAAGADDYVTKPFQSEEVLARVRVHLARRMLEAKL